MEEERASLKVRKGFAASRTPASDALPLSLVAASPPLSFPTVASSRPVTMKLGALLEMPNGDSPASCRGEDWARQGMAGLNIDAETGETCISRFESSCCSF